jgi:RNA polymerase sigma factor (sigma-70 family)
LDEGAKPRFDELIRRYGRLVARVVAKVAGKHAPADLADIEQQVLISLWQQVSREQRVDHPSSYLYRAAVREAARALKKVTRREETAIEAAAQTIDGKSGPHEDAAAAQLRERLETALSKLSPERQRAARAHLVGLDVEELMRLEGWPYQKARNLIARGMSELRDALKELGVDAH